MPQYRADGDKLDHTPTSNVAAGDIVVLGSLVTVADRDIAANTLGAVLTHGVVVGNCATGATAAAGSSIRWNATSGVFHESTGTVAGYLARARVATDSTVQVLLWPGA